MKYIEWDPKKNERLKKERGVSFEEVVDVIFEGRVFGRIDHPNQKKYSGQKIFIIEMQEYVYVIPYVEDKEKVFFKTIFPSRKYTKVFIEKGVV